VKRVQFTQEQVEYNVFLFDDHLKGSKSLKIFKINLTFRFDKLSHLSKIRSHRTKFSNSDSVEPKKKKLKHVAQWRRKYFNEKEEKGTIIY
jgi:hypothetical protein